MTNTATLPTVTLNSTFKLGRKSYTMKDGIQQAVACYDQLYLLQEDMLKNYRELGNILLQIEALFLGNKKAYGSFIATTDLNNEAVSSADKYDAKWIATHWTKVQKLNKNGKLNSLGVSSIRKIVIEAHPELRKKPKAEKPASAGNTSKGKPKGSTATKGGNSPERIEEIVKNTVFQTVVAKNEVELAEQVFDQMQELGFNKTKFTKALQELYKKS
jgi:pentatricopeptide repeat protein